MGIEQREDDQIKALIAVLDVAAGVILHGANPRRAVRLLKVKLLSQSQNERINFHGGNVLSAVAKCSCDVIAHSRAQDQDGRRLRIKTVREIVSIPPNGDFLK